MLINHPFHYISGAIFFPSLFLILHFLARRYFYRRKVPVSHKVIDENDVWEIASNLFCSSQALLTTACGLVIVARCSDFLHDRFWLTNAYARFGLPYFVVDTYIMIVSFNLRAKNPKPPSFFSQFLRFLVGRPLMALHHLILPLIFAPVILIYRRNLGDYAIGCVYMMEATIPFIQCRHLLYNLKLTNTALYMWNGIIMVMTFIVCRIGILVFLFIKYSFYRGIGVLEVPAAIPKCCTIGTVIILVPQIYWTARMLQGLRQYFRPSKKSI